MHFKFKGEKFVNLREIYGVEWSKAIRFGTINASFDSSGNFNGAIRLQTPPVFKNNFYRRLSEQA